MPYERSGSIPTEKRISEGRAFLKLHLPVCQVCGIGITGHQFKHVASAPVLGKDPEQAKALVRTVKEGDWNSLTKYQDWRPHLPSIDVIGLKCLDDRCSLAVLLCPYSLDEPYVLIVQREVPDCKGPVQGGFWGTV